MNTQFAAAPLALLCSFAAAAGGLQRSFQVGAVVVASANVSSTLTRGGSGAGISVRTAGYRAPAAALLVNDTVRVISDPASATLAAPASGDSMVTVLY